MALFDNKNKVSIESIGKQAFQDEKKLADLLDGVLSKQEDIRYKSFKTLLFICGEKPDVLYPKWDFFSGLLESDNPYHKQVGMYVIASLAGVDSQNKFERISDKYFDLLNSPSVMNAGHAALNAGKIAKAKPHLRGRVTDLLLNMDKTYPVKERVDLVIGYAIDAFDVYFEEAEDKDRIVEFVMRHVDSSSFSTKKKAVQFLKKWESHLR
ncbi:MAG: hypothetical protein ACQXXD_01485 [Thermoplasmatota archaeon]|jgi:hypothetical protein